MNRLFPILVLFEAGLIALWLAGSSAAGTVLSIVLGTHFLYLLGDYLKQVDAPRIEAEARRQRRERKVIRILKGKEPVGRLRREQNLERAKKIS